MPRLPKQNGARSRQIDLEDESDGQVMTGAMVAAAKPVTVAPPDTKDLDLQRVSIDQLIVFRVTDDASYVEASRKFQDVSAYLDAVNDTFKDPVQSANKVHKFLTRMRSFFLSPGEQAKANLNGQIFAWKAKKDAERRAEEDRLRREQERLLAEQRAEAERIAAEEKARYEAALAELMPWETESVLPPPEPDPYIAPEPVAIRLPSNLPAIQDGPTFRNKPWQARVVDPVAFLRWIIEAPADRLGYIDFRLPALNSKAREHQGNLGKVIPGVEGFQEQTLAS